MSGPSKKRNLSGYMWIFGISAMLIYEFWSLINDIPGDTLSEAVWDWGLHPMIPFAVGVLIGHFFWQRQSK